MANTSLTFPRETAEFLPLGVLDRTTPVVGYSVCVLPYRQRPAPADWTAATVVNGDYGVMVQNLTRGVYTVWVKDVANPEVPVIRVDNLVIT